MEEIFNVFLKLSDPVFAYFADVVTANLLHKHKQVRQSIVQAKGCMKSGKN